MLAQCISVLHSDDMKALVPFKRSTTPGAPYYVRFEVKKRAYLWSTKTDDLALAKKRGRDYRAKIIAERFDLVDHMRTTSRVPTFAELEKAYHSLPAPKPSTKRGNVNCLKIFLAAVGLKESDHVDRLDGKLVVMYQQRCLAEGKGSDSAIYSCNTRVRSARSLFSKRALACYGLELPHDKIASFFRIPLLPEPEKRPELPSDGALSRVSGSLQDKPEHYRAYLLARYAGCRAGEIAAARRDWLEGCKLHIGGREFNAKSRRWRCIELPQEVAKLLTLSDDPVFLVGSNRIRVVYRELPGLLKGLGFPKKKPLHSLRRLYGQHVYVEQGPRLARDALGHSEQRVTDAFYCRSVDTPRALAFTG